MPPSPNYDVLRGVGLFSPNENLYIHSSIYYVGASINSTIHAGASNMNIAYGSLWREISLRHSGWSAACSSMFLRTELWGHGRMCTTQNFGTMSFSVSLSFFSLSIPPGIPPPCGDRLVS